MATSGSGGGITNAKATPSYEEYVRREAQRQAAKQQATAAQTAQPQAASPAYATPAQDAYANRGTPYLNIAQSYEDRARANLAAQEAVLAKQLAASQKSTNVGYDSAAAGNYVNYMRQQNALPEQLARQGVRGGASESAMTRIGNNYALNQGNTNAARASALGQLQTAYDTNIMNMRQNAEDNILNNNLALQQSLLQYDDTLAQRAAEEARYIAEVERAARERAEDIARDDARYATEQGWKQKEWTRYSQEKKVEEYAAGLTRYTGSKGIANLQKLRKNIKKDKNWASNPYKYGRVQAINARIGTIKAEMKK